MAERVWVPDPTDDYEEPRTEEGSTFRTNESLPSEVLAVEPLFDWRDAVEESFMRATYTSPAQIPGMYQTPMLLGERYGMGLQKAVNDARQRDPSRAPFLSEEQRAQDRYLIAFEEAYYANRGTIPADFLLHFSENDLKLIGLDETGIQATQQMERIMDIQAMVLDDDKKTEQAEQERVTRLMDVFNWSRQRALEEEDKILQVDEKRKTLIYRLQEGGPVAMTQFIAEHDRAWAQSMLGDETLEESVQRRSKQIRPEEMIQRIEQIIEQDYLPQWDAEVGGLATVQSDTRIFGVDFTGGSSSRTVFEGGNTSIAGYLMGGATQALGVLGTGIQKGVNGFDWLVGEMGEFFWETDFPLLPGEPDAPGSFKARQADFAANLNRGFERLYADSTFREDRDAVRTDLEAQLGMPEQQQIMGLGLPSARATWDMMRATRPEVYQEWLAMGGGNPTQAFAMFTEEMLFQTDFHDLLIKQNEERNELSRQVLQKMDDENYTLGDGILELLSLYGEGVETLATWITAGGRALWEELPGVDGEGLSGFWENAQGSDTPSAALDIDGTLTGLATDLLLSAIVDPLNVFFAAKLSSSARIGAVHAAAARRGANSPVTAIAHRNLAEVVAGSRKPIAAATLIDNYAQTGNAARMLDAAGGYTSTVDPLARLWLDDPDAKQVVTLKYDRLMDMEGMEVTPADMTKARKRIEARGGIKMEDVPEVTYNPETGTATVTKNADVVGHLMGRQIDGIPVRVKIDENFGVSRKPTHPKSAEIDLTPADITFIERLARGEDPRPPDAAVVPSNTNMVDDLRKTQEGYNKVGKHPGEGKSLAGTFTMGDGQTLEIYRTRSPAGSGYMAVLDGQLIGEVDTLLVRKAKRMTIAVLPEHSGANLLSAEPNPRSVVDIFYDVARDDGGELLTYTIRGHSVSDDALRSAQRQAGRWINEFSEVEAAGTAVPNWKRPAADAVGKNGYISARRVMDDETLYPGADFEEMKKIEYDHIMDGGDSVAATRTVVTMQAARAFRHAIDTVGVGDWIDQWMHPINTNIRMEFTNPNSASVIHQASVRIWSSVNDMETLNLYTQRQQKFWSKREGIRRRARELDAEARAMHAQILALESDIADGKAFRVSTNDGSATGTTQRMYELRLANKQLELIRRKRELRAFTKGNEKLYAQLNNYKELHNLMDEMYREYNIKHIATNPKLADLVVKRGKNKGMVPWEEINGGRRSAQQQIDSIQAKIDAGMEPDAAIRQEMGYVPKRLLQAFRQALNDNKIMGKVDNDFFNQVMHNLHTSTAYIAPLSPLEMMAAPGASKRQLLAMNKRGMVQHIKRFGHEMHQWWMMEKVLTPRTGFTVGLDEAMRMWHTGGAKSWVQWAEDRAISVAKAVQFMRLNNKLTDRWNARLVALEQYPNFFRQVERSFLETRGVGLDEIRFKPNKKERGKKLRLDDVGSNREYYEAAQRTAGQQLSEEYIQNFFKGPEAFREWFETSRGAEWMRTMDYYDAETGVRRSNPSWEVAYQGIETVVEVYFLRGIKKERKGEALAKWKEAAERAEARGSQGRGGPTILPKWVLEGFESVTGNRKIPTRNPITKGVEAISEQLFQKPMNYRRGFLAEMVRKSEWARLKKLYGSQNIKIVSDAQWQRELRTRYPNISSDVLGHNMGHIRSMMRERYHVVSEAHLHEMVEHKVVAEMENQLYAFHMQSRLGQKAKAIFPFGKPWADMWGFWGRETFSRPHLRGWLNKENYSKIGDVAEGIIDYFPGNPRTGAFVSRIAATDFDLENVDEDPIFGKFFRGLGIEEFDVGTALFLPAGGENPWATMIPGFGIVPTGLLHIIFDRMAPDPVDDPQGYQQWMAEWGQFVPSLRYNRPHGAGDTVLRTVAGGGITSRITDLTQALDLYFNPDQGPTPHAISGDHKLGLTYLRGVQLAFGEQGALEKLIQEFEALPPEAMNELALEAIINEMLSGIANEAARKNAIPLITEAVTEFAVPAKVNAVDIPQDIAKVWTRYLEAGAFPLLDASRFDLETDEGREKAAEIIRKHWYDLDDYAQNIILAQNPGLAVNLVSLWEKTDLGRQRLGEEPYKTGGSEFRQDLHQNLIEMGYITPKNPRAFAIEIMGVQMQARQNLAIDLYSELAGNINDFRWEIVQTGIWDKEDGPGIVETLEGILGIIQANDLAPWTEPIDIYHNFRKAQDLVVRHITEGWGDEFFDLSRENQELIRDGLRKDFSMPTKAAPWDAELPGDGESLRDELEFGFPVFEEFITDRVLELASALDIEVESGQEFFQFYQDIADYRARQYLDNPLYVEVMDEFQVLRMPRSAARNTFSTAIGTSIDHSQVDPRTRTSYKQALVFLDEAIRLRNELPANDTSWIALRDKGLERLGRMNEDKVLRALGIPNLYNEAYGRQLGEWDWEPDKPAPLWDGPELSNMAQRVHVTDFVDGDTITVAERGMRRMFRAFGGPNLRPDAFTVRLLGINARELAEEGGEEDTQRLEDTVMTALEEGTPIYIVRDPERYGNTDRWGRQFSWLYIGDEPYYFPETQIPPR